MSLHLRTALRLAAPLWAAVALALGLGLARLPTLYGAALLGGGAVVALSLWEPALAIGLAVMLGPARAFLAIARPDVPADLGQLFFALAVAGWLARGLARRRLVVPHLPLLLPLSLYLGVGLLSLLAAASLPEGLKEALKWVEIILAVVILAGEFARGRAWWVIAAVLGAGLLQAAIGLWQYGLRGSGPEHFRIASDLFRAYGTFEQPNPFGGFLGLLWPLAAGLALAYVGEAWRTRRVRPGLLAGVFGGIAVVLLVALYVSYSRGAWLGAAAAALALAIALPRRWWLGLGLVLAGGLLFWGLARAGLMPASVSARLADVTDFVDVRDVRGVNITAENFAIVERLAHWQAAAAMADAHPWLGVGLGNYAEAYPQYRLLNWPNALGHAHMIYLNVLAETGLLGLAAYAILWVWVFALTIQAAGRLEGAWRGLALGLWAAWVHLSIHQIVDNLYVNNIHLAVGALLGLLAYAAQRAQRAAPAVALDRPERTRATFS